MNDYLMLKRMMKNIEDKLANKLYVEVDFEKRSAIKHICPVMVNEVAAERELTPKIPFNIEVLKAWKFVYGGAAWKVAYCEKCEMLYAQYLGRYLSEGD